MLQVVAMLLFLYMSTAVTTGDLTTYISEPYGSLATTTVQQCSPEVSSGYEKFLSSYISE